MHATTPLPQACRKPRSKESIRRHECSLTDAEGNIPIPAYLPPPPPTPTASPSYLPLLTPNAKTTLGFPAGSATAFRSKILSSTPYMVNRVVRNPSVSRKASPFPLLIPTEITLGIVRESPLTVVEELTRGDRAAGGGKEDSLSSTRPSEESLAITEQQSVAYGAPRETSIPAAAATTAVAAAAAAAGVTTVEETSVTTDHTMGACTSKKSSSGSVKKSEKSPPTIKAEEPRLSVEIEPDEVNDEEDPAQMPKFKLKRDSIAVTKVRLMKTQIQQENTIGEEEEDDEDDEDFSERGEDHVHFDSHVSKQSIPNDSGVSLNSCPDNDSENLWGGDRGASDQDYSSIRFDGKLDCDSANEISLASNVTIRSLRKERIVEDDSPGMNFKSILERTKQLFGNHVQTTPGSLRRVSTRR